MARSPTKYEKLWATYEDLMSSISSVQEPRVACFCSSWESAKKGYEQALRSGMTASQIASGLAQGLRELPMLFREIGGDQRAELLHLLHIAVLKNYPEFFDEDASLLASIVERGKIRNAREYDVVRHRIDELEGDVRSSAECEMLCKLVDQFER